jgi:phage tail-like protein
MARAASSDPYLGFKFHVVDPAGGNLDPVAGFSAVTMPEITDEPAEYREGIYRWTRKFPGVPTVGDMTLTKGVVKRESDFLAWIMRVINGGATEYRTDLTVLEYHITDESGITGSPSRITRVSEVFPTSVKATADKDATGSEVSLQELTLACEELATEIIPSQ